MTNSTPDRFETLRREIIAGATQDLRRTRRRVQLAKGTLGSVAMVFVLTGIASAASSDVARAVRGIPGGAIFDVFHGNGDRNPSAAGQDAVSRMDHTFSEAHGTIAPKNEPTKVLLDTTVDGVEVEIVATKRLVTGADQVATCYIVSTNGQDNGFTCSPEMMPGLPVNFTTTIEQSSNKVRVQELAGITDDTVKTIDVKTKTGTRPAAMGDHAFWWRATPGETPVSLLIHLTNGSSISHPL